MTGRCPLPPSGPRHRGALERGVAQLERPESHQGVLGSDPGRRRGDQRAFAQHHRGEDGDDGPHQRGQRAGVLDPRLAQHHRDAAQHRVGVEPIAGEAEVGGHLGEGDGEARPGEQRQGERAAERGAHGGRRGAGGHRQLESRVTGEPISLALRLEPGELRAEPAARHHLALGHAQVGHQPRGSPGAQALDVQADDAQVLDGGVEREGGGQGVQPAQPLGRIQPQLQGGDAGLGAEGAGDEVLADGEAARLEGQPARAQGHAAQRLERQGALGAPTALVAELHHPQLREGRVDPVELNRPQPQDLRGGQRRGHRVGEQRGARVAFDGGEPCHPRIAGPRGSDASQEARADAAGVDVRGAEPLAQELPEHDVRRPLLDAERKLKQRVLQTQLQPAHRDLARPERGRSIPRQLEVDLRPFHPGDALDEPRSEDPVDEHEVEQLRDDECGREALGAAPEGFAVHGRSLCTFGTARRPGPPRHPFRRLAVGKRSAPACAPPRWPRGRHRFEGQGPSSRLSPCPGPLAKVTTG